MPKSGPNSTAVVVGRDTASAQAAIDLTQAGADVTLLTAGEWLVPGDGGPAGVPPLLQAAQHPRIRLLTGACVEAVRNGGSAVHLTVQQSPRYIDPERCTACGACTDVCPILLPGKEGHMPHKAIYQGGVPTVFAIDKAGMAPCRDACPIDQRAQGYVALIRDGRYRAAYEAIKRENPFPSVCGRVCNHRCEDNCTRCQVDEPVAVMALKRFVADWAAEQGLEIERDVAPPSGYRVAVVGAGPAGLTAARELNRLGHDVTVLEALPVPGGMMRVGIPGFRLPRKRLQWEIDEILSEGVLLRTNSPVHDVESLFADGYHAVVLAVGLHKSRRLSLPGAQIPAAAQKRPGDTLSEVVGAVEFLRTINLGERPDWRGRRVVVVGGGSTAMDTARICRRLGAEVQVVYRRSQVEMPAHDSEIEDAQREGVTIRFLTNPTRILRQEGSLVAVECVSMKLGAPDESGRRRPAPVEDSEFTVPADAVLLAIGQDSDLSLLSHDGGVVTRNGSVQHDPSTLMTDRAGLFVAGDVAGSDGFVVDAIASGLQVARSTDRYLRGDQSVREPIRQPVVQLDDAQVALRLREAAPRGARRARTHSTSPETLLGDFGETEAGLSEMTAMAEAARCLSCGLCSECLACVTACPAHAIDHERRARVFELQAGAVLWAEGDGRPNLGLAGPHPALVLARDLAVGGAHDGSPLTSAVDQVLARLGLARRVKERIAAPSRWVGDGGERSGALDDSTRSMRYGLFLCRCGGEIERTVDLAQVATLVAARFASAELPALAHVGNVDFACHIEASRAIRAIVDDKNLDGAVLAACSCCALDQICYSCTTQRTRCKERLGVWDDLQGLPFEFVNLREQCAFVHRHDPAAATRKAADLVVASFAALAIATDRPPHPVGDRPPGLMSRLSITAKVDPVRCRGCDDCQLACGLDAMHLVGVNGSRLAQVDVARCLGCGVCLAVCSSGAIQAGDTSDVQAEAMLASMGDLSDRTVVFSCNWGAYSAVEAAGVERRAVDPSVRLIRMMCAGRVHEGLLLRAFAQSAARVLVLACGHTDDGPACPELASLCFYGTGNDQAARAVAQTQTLLDLLGIDPARLALVEMEPGAAARFVDAVNDLGGSVPVIGPEKANVQ